MYKCLSCGKQFRGGRRLINALLWHQYTEGKQTYAQLAAHYGCSLKTIQRRLDAVQLTHAIPFESAVNLLLDTTYFGRGFGVMVFMDSITGTFLHTMYVKAETNSLYLKGFEEIRARGIAVQSIICDGRKGLRQIFSSIPMQMCQFHQLQIITRYLTKNPKAPAAIALKRIANSLTKADRATFTNDLLKWFRTWEEYLKERTISALTGKSHYTHRKLRSAWLSLQRNLNWLFTFEEFPELMIPNTTNQLEGSFSALKNKLRNHNGMNLERKIKMINHYFKI